MKYGLILVAMIGFISPSFAKTSIQVKIENYESDTLLLGYYYWDKQYIKDSLFRNDKGLFEIEYEEELPHGMYMLITLPNHNFVQFILDEDQKFEVQWDESDAFNTLKFNGSKENESFRQYVEFLNNARAKAEELQGREDFNPSMMDSLDAVVKEEQKQIMTNQPNSMAALVIRTNEEVDMPFEEANEGEDEEAYKERRYSYFLKHYLDNVDLGDPRLPYTSFLYPKIDRYMKKVVMQIPDSINRAMDRLLEKSAPSPTTFKVILVHYLNEYANSEYVGMDGVYVHLIDNYYSKGKAPWVDEESLLKMQDDADGLRPILIGKNAPEITVMQQDGTPLNLYDIESEYLVIIFWAPDCGHCKKAMPKLINMYDDIKSKGGEVLAVCSKLLEKEETCWTYINENGTNLWLNGTDKYLRSKFKQKYNIKSTPQVFILDRDKKILTKKIAIEKVPEVLDLLKSMETAQVKN